MTDCGWRLPFHPTGFQIWQTSEQQHFTGLNHTLPGDQCKAEVTLQRKPFLTSRLSSGEDGQFLCDLNQDLFLSIRPLFHLIPFLVRVRQLKLRQQTHTIISTTNFQYDNTSPSITVLWQCIQTVIGYLLAWWCRWSKDGLPVGPGKHHKANVKHQQIRHCKHS